VRPATPLICQFIDKHKQAYGVVPICRALAVHGVQIAPRTYWAHRSAAPSKRALWDTTITEILAGIYEPGIDGRRPPESAVGFGYTAFVIDAYAGVITGWECSLRKDTEFVERALRNAAAFRARQGHPLDDAIHHSDAGSQYTAMHFGETLMLAGLQPSVGTVGDALDNALCETTIGLYKTECIRDGSPFRTGPIRTLTDLEDITSAWVSWYNTRRLMHRLARRPPAEIEAEYFARLQAGKHTGHP
jgi:transposase InsO family protein